MRFPSTIVRCVGAPHGILVLPHTVLESGVTPRLVERVTSIRNSSLASPPVASVRWDGRGVVPSPAIDNA